MAKPKKRPDRPPGSPMRVVLYSRVSTAEQAESGAGLAAQETALRAHAAHRGWEAVAHLTDAGVSGKSLSGRPALSQALQLVTSGGAEALAVAKLDRLSRSLLDFAGLMARSQAEGWALVALDVDVDTTTPSGRLVANVMASVAEWERETIGARTRDSLAAKRAQGVVLGRPRSASRKAVARVRALRSEGLSYAAAAERLTAEGVPTAHGGARWYPSTVRKVLLSAERADVPQGC
jgi:DNA invertase Pin-like site-specific DNA recombinase